MPYLKNGNCRAFLQQHPDTSRLQIVRDLTVISLFWLVMTWHKLYDVSLGLVHLHSHQIVHGYLKGVGVWWSSNVFLAHKNIILQFNVLIDDSPKAVLCDFGLSQVRADVTSRTVLTAGSDIIGSPNWMAPELLQGGLLKPPCDIYAFGMTLYEVSIDFTRSGFAGWIKHLEDIREWDSVELYQIRRLGLRRLSCAPRCQTEAARSRCRSTTLKSTLGTCRTMLGEGS